MSSTATVARRAAASSRVVARAGPTRTSAPTTSATGRAPVNTVQHRRLRRRQCVYRRRRLCRRHVRAWCARARGACSATQTCERTVARELSSCIARVGARMRRCYLKTGAACPPGEPWSAQAAGQGRPPGSMRECSDAATVQALGYGAAATPATVTARVQEACTGEVASIAARTFGGPQGALLAGADAHTSPVCRRRARQPSSSSSARRTCGRRASRRRTAREAV